MELERSSILNRAIWTFVFFAVLNIGTQMFGQWGAWSGYAYVGPLTTLAGIIGIVVTWTLPTRYHVALERAGMVTAVVTVLLYQAPIIATLRYFNTDAAAFNQRAAQLLLAGINPYQAAFTQHALALDHPAAYWTYTLTGHYVNTVSYPAGSFLFQAPLQWLGVTHMTTNWVDLLAWIGAAVMLYFVSPWYAKWMSPMLLLATEFTYLFTHGGTDALFVPFVMLAAWRWDDFVDRAAPTWTKWVGPAALGVACSIKQTPWFAVVFFAVGIAIEAQHHAQVWWRALARYLAIVVAAFLVVNAPFIVWSPSSWWRGTLLPLTSPLVPDGQGLVGLALHGLVRGVHTSYLDIGALFVLLALLGVYVLWYPVMKRAWLFVLPVVLYIPSRSLSTYLVDFIPAAIVMALTTHRVPPEWADPFLAKWRRFIVATPLVLGVAAIVYAFSFPVITVKAEIYHSSHYNQYIDPMYMSFENNTSSTLHPHVMLVVGSGHPVGFWTPEGGGPLVLAPHQTTQVWMMPPHYMGPPTYQQSWLIEVLTRGPNAMSVSRVYSWPYGKKYSDNP